MTCLLGLNIVLRYSDVASMTLHFFDQFLVQHVIQLQFLQVFLENLFIFSDEVKKELPEAHIFSKSCEDGSFMIGEGAVETF